jgi:Mg-chelatase subunit ChlD
MPEIAASGRRSELESAAWLGREDSSQSEFSRSRIPAPGNSYYSDPAAPAVATSEAQVLTGKNAYNDGPAAPPSATGSTAVIAGVLGFGGGKQEEQSSPERDIRYKFRTLKSDAQPEVAAVDKNGRAAGGGGGGLDYSMTDARERKSVNGGQITNSPAAITGMLNIKISGDRGNVVPTESTTGIRSGDQPVKGETIDRLLSSAPRDAKTTSETDEKSPSLGDTDSDGKDVPVLGSLFANKDNKAMESQKPQSASARGLTAEDVVVPAPTAPVAGAASWKGAAQSKEMEKLSLQDLEKAKQDESGVVGEKRKERDELLLKSPATLADASPPVENLEKALEEQKKAVFLQQDVLKEINAAAEPYSTFSLRVNDASFKLAYAALSQGQRPAAESVRMEEFYNAFDYGDPMPIGKEPIACAIDQAAHPFAASRNLLRISMRTAAAGRSAGQPLHLTLLIDQSGSMNREDRLSVMEASIKELTTLLTADDQVSVIGFSRTPRLLGENIAGNDAATLRKLMMLAPTDGGTNMEEALNLGEVLATRNKANGAQNRILLVTDGAANLGNADPQRLANRIKLIRQKGLAFDIAGIGTDGLNDEMLLELSRHGNGRYYVINNVTDAKENFARQLAGAFRPAAENVKVQVQLNPQRVASYSLLGFVKDRLKTEDFRNDKVDAAELAAAEAGNAMYQVAILPEGTGDIGEVSVRFRDTATGEMVERKWTILYDANTPPFDLAQPSMQLSGLALFTAEKLRGGALGDAVRFADVSQSVTTVGNYYRQSERVSQLLEMTRILSN